MRNSITKQRIHELQTSGVPVKLIDIRTNEEFQKQHIPGVINIPSEILTDMTSQFLKDEIIVCVCNHGKERSQKAAETLYNSGFTQTFYLEGGTAGWLE